ncbi:MAG: DnaA/Hda family protein, partial [Boseongicola sp.]
MHDETWGTIREELLRSVGKNNYVNWIEPLEYSGFDDGVVKFLVPTQFMGNWVSRNFGEQILQQWKNAGIDVSRVKFAVPEMGVKPRRNGPTKLARTVAFGDQPGAPLDNRFSFDSFVVGKPNELAHAAARRVAEGGPVTFNPLFLYGGVGLGKTHLMHAIAWELQKR